jgi:predicted Rossmann fold nucleotide-binding protein DprA/Smf involved in DNA uptake
MSETDLTTIASSLDDLIAALGTKLRAATAARQALSTALNGEAPGITAEQIEQARLDAEPSRRPVDDENVAPVEQPKAARERRSDEEWAALEERVLIALRGDGEMRVATIAERAGLENREVSMVLQRLVKRDDVDVRPGVKKGYWRLVAKPEQASLPVPPVGPIYPPSDEQTEDGATDEGNRTTVEQG